MARIGLLTSWNEESAQSAHVRRMLASFPDGHFCVLADLPKPQGQADPAFVTRCWEPLAESHADLEQAISRQGIEILHISSHDHTLFARDAFVALLGRLKRKGVRVLIQLQSTYTLDPSAAALFGALDRVVVNDSQNRLEAIANGAAPENVSVLAPCIPSYPQPKDRTALRLKHKIPADEKLVLAFGFIQPNKGMEAVIEAVARMQAKGVACRGMIVGKTNPEHLGSRDYFNQLNAISSWSGVSERMIVQDRFVPEQELLELIAIADLVIFNNHSQAHEISSACAMAIGAGALVATSLAPAFACFGDAVWNITSGFPAGLSAEVLFGSRQLRESVLAAAAGLRRERSPERMRDELAAIYSRLGAPGVASAVKPARESEDPARTEACAAARPPCASTPAQCASASPSAVIYDMSGGATEFQELIERGELATRSMELATAHGHFAQAEKLGMSARLLRGRGAVFMAEQDLANASGYFERALAMDPRDVKSHCGLGICELRSGRAAPGYEHFVRALEIEPGNLLSLRHLVECAYALSRFDHLERALRLYLAEHKQDHEMRFCLAGCLYKIGKNAEAAALADEILRQRPGHSAAKELKDLIARATAQASRVPEGPPPAVATALQAATPPPVSYDDFDRHLDELEEQKRLRNLEEVRTGCTKLLSSGRLNETQKQRTRILEAEINLLSGQTDLAQRTYDEVLLVNPRNARALCGKGVIAANRNSVETALGFFEQARMVEPRYDMALSGLGLCMQLTGKQEKAWEHYLQALEVNPENSRALLGVIEIGYKLKRFCEVEKALEDYIEMHPADLNFLYALAGCYYAQGKLGPATELLSKVLLFDPEHKNSLELQAAINDKMEDEAASG